jgi:predicted dehydrogenase
MNIAVIGLGSMGKRRIRLLQEYIKREELNKNEWQIYGMDTRIDRREETEFKYGIKTFDDISDMLDFCELAVICTSPLSHSLIIHECLRAGLDVFSEINLVDDGYDESIRLAKEQSCVLFLSSTFLYRNENKFIIKKAQLEEKPLNYTYHVGQYLPDWHPWETISDYFISYKRTNGCRELMAIEFPWLIAAFGPVSSVIVRKSKNTGLPIDYCDNYMILLEHYNNNLVNKGMLTIDVMSRKPVRKFEMFNENTYITWEGKADTLFMYDNQKRIDRCVMLYDEVEHLDGYNDMIIENAYYNEIKTFMDCVRQRDLTCGGNYSFSNDKNVLELIDKIEDLTCAD